MKKQRYLAGGAAFPMPAGTNGARTLDQLEWNAPQQGMSLREWYAGMSLKGIRSSGVDLPSNDAAKLALQDADALLRNR